MSSRIPAQPAAESGSHRTELEARPGHEPAAAVSAARGRALRDGDRQIDTAHLLHPLLESDPGVRAVFDGGPQVARLLGCLVQRSIGYGPGRQGAVEGSGAVPVVAEAGWSPAAAGAMERACVRAGVCGGTEVRCLDLLAAIVADPRTRAVEVLRRAGVDVRVLLPRIEGASRSACADE
ncbi:Clp protease N-terminal domain-containing protein [Streptomyces sp. NPDC005732]|uniref:Clp protease N-terminal domain-containing protein n=1 Tax=Streptomyces sp. NPDC005732 TaxID=3157057 RepID=UPI0033DF1F39